MNNIDNYAKYVGKKEFNQKSYDENDHAAKNEGVKLLSQFNCKLKTHAELYKKGDSYFDMYIGGKVETKLFEFERRGRGLSWNDDRFPFFTIHVPGRKVGAENLYDFYLLFNYNLNRAALIRGLDVKNSKRIDIDTTNNDTKEMTTGEEFADIDCSLVYMFKKIDELWLKSSGKGRTWVAKG